MDTAKLSQIKKALTGQQDDGQDVARLRTGVISAVNTNGTVDVTLSGVTVAGVPYLVGAGVAVGAIVQMLSYRGSLLVLGTSAGSSQAPSGWSLYLDADQSGTTSATGVEYMSVNLPNAGTYVYDVLWVVTNTTNASAPGFALGGTAPVSSYVWASQTNPPNSTTGMQGLRATGTSHPTNVELIAQNNWLAATSFGSIHIKGRIVVTNGGTLTFRLGRQAGTGTITVRGGTVATVERAS